MTAGNVIPLVAPLIAKGREYDDVAKWTSCPVTRAQAIARRDELFERASKLRPHLVESGEAVEG